jgi:hypothetical protein
MNDTFTQIMCFFPKPLTVDVNSAKANVRANSSDRCAKKYLGFVNKIELCLHSTKFKKKFLKTPNCYIILDLKPEFGSAMIDIFNQRNKCNIGYEPYFVYPYSIMIYQDTDLDNPQFK